MSRVSAHLEPLGAGPSLGPRFKSIILPICKPGGYSRLIVIPESSSVLGRNGEWPGLCLRDSFTARWCNRAKDKTFEGVAAPTLTCPFGILTLVNLLSKKERLQQSCQAWLLFGAEVVVVGGI